MPVPWSRFTTYLTEGGVILLIRSFPAPNRLPGLRGLHRLIAMSRSFRAAVESRDLEAIAEALAPNVVFRSPAVYKPYEGRDAVGALLAAVSTVFEDFRYTAQIDDGEREVLIFEARVGDREVQGVDIIRFDAGGLVAELTVMVRPMSGLLALVDAMEEQLPASSS